MDVVAAAREYIELKERKRHPDGKFDKAGRWYPSRTERQTCCSEIRSPSAKWPYSLSGHCRSLEHVACRCGHKAESINRVLWVLKTFEGEQQEKLLNALRVSAACGVEPLNPRELTKLSKQIEEEQTDG